MEGVRATYICSKCDHEYLSFNTRKDVFKKCPQCKTTNAPGYEVNYSIFYSRWILFLMAIPYAYFETELSFGSCRCKFCFCYRLYLLWMIFLLSPIAITMELHWNAFKEIAASPKNRQNSQFFNFLSFQKVYDWKFFPNLNWCTKRCRIN